MMNAYEHLIDQATLQIGIVLQKYYFRYSILTRVTVLKHRDLPLLFFLLIENPDQRLEIHPTSIQEIIKVEDSNIYYLILQKRPSLSTKDDQMGDYWSPDILEFKEEDPFFSLIIPHFMVIRLEFMQSPIYIEKYFSSMKIQIFQGFFQDIDSTSCPINIPRLFWLMPWDIKYSIFVLLTNRKMTVDDLTEENLAILATIPDCARILEFMFCCSQAFSIEKLLSYTKRLVPKEEPPPGHVSVRKLLVSPSALVFMPHEIDLGNRVVRDKDCDEFIRINFVDEYNDRNVWYHSKNALDKFKGMLKGFSLLGRYFEFLGFSNSQMRNHSCWMVHVTKSCSAEKLRETLGSFEYVKTVSKYASRLGLCFSGTYGTVEIDSDRIFIIDDITNGKYVFSDGIGMISPDLFKKAIMKIHVKEKQVISALQVRIGGCKGVLTLTPDIHNCIYVRESMNKFKSEHFKLELCSYAVSHPGYLNRQIILVLSGLGVKDNTFLKLQQLMINELSYTLCSEVTAEMNLRKTNPSYYRDLVYMLSNNLKLSEDAYLKGMINAHFLANVKLIKSKARILAPDSRLLMGVLDEYAVLEYGQVFIQITEDNNSMIITNKVAVGKNPCYHPGDIRVLQAVNHPRLAHLHNVLVFPQKGSRPHPNECSGSDLDGDLYFVTWNEELVPEEHVEPMDYDSPAEKVQEDPINIEKVIDFFANFMESENIGRISNAHLVWADRNGVACPQALTLARLTSVAVDYPKTGIPAIMPMELRITSWPDFMEKTGKKSYESQGIIGKLWRACTLASFDFNLEHKVDERFLVEGYSNYLAVAQRMYKIYSAKISKLINQYDCENEFFLITAQSGEHSKKKMRYDDNLQIQSLIVLFREEVHKTFRQQTENLVERRKIASACYYYAYSKKKIDKKHVFLSFPWIFYDYLL